MLRIVSSVLRGRGALVAYLVFFALMAAAPLILARCTAESRYWVDVLNSVGLYLILALSLNVILGYAGMFNMGHAVFFAIGAYVTAILNTRCGWPTFWTFPFAGLAAAVFALAAARPIIHLRGDYLLIVTIGMVEIVRIALVNDVFGLTGGANGITGIERIRLFGFKFTKPVHYFYLIWGFAGLTVLLFSLLENSRFGRALCYLKEDEAAAQGCGINAARCKLAAFALGACWAGICGTLFAAKMTIISPESFNFWESVVLFMIVILGGSGSISGVILGAFLVAGLPELFRGFEHARQLVFGIALMVMMIVRPQGLLPPRPRRYPAPAKPAASPSPEIPTAEAAS